MSLQLHRLLALAVALAVTAGIAALSRAPFTPPGADRAMLRLSWRMPAESAEECRRPTAEELERLPVHMRPEWICEGQVTPYRLLVELDGRLLLEETIYPAGARGDRPFFVLREFPLEPGSYDLRVRWEREAPDPPLSAVATPGEPSSRYAREVGAVEQELPEPDLAGRRDGAPERLELAAALSLSPGEVALVTYDVDRRVLVARGPGLRQPDDG